MQMEGFFLDYGNFLEAYIRYQTCSLVSLYEYAYYYIDCSIHEMCELY